MNKFRLNTKLISSLSTVLYTPSAELIKAAAISTTTWYHIMQQPALITIQQLLGMANGLHIPVRRFFSTGKADVIGHRDDYVADPYDDCYYDANALQKVIDNRKDATWRKAATATGITYNNLRKSLLAERRTPVTRFLIVCETFRIDPFAILVDPNRSPVKRDGPAKQQEAEALNAINALRRDFDTLNDAVADLTVKYEALLREHEQLLHRINVTIDTVNGSYIGIAAERLEPRGNK